MPVDFSGVTGSNSFGYGGVNEEDEQVPNVKREHYNVGMLIGAKRLNAVSRTEATPLYPSAATPLRIERCGCRYVMKEGHTSERIVADTTLADCTARRKSVESVEPVWQIFSETACLISHRSHSNFAEDCDEVA